MRKIKILHFELDRNVGGIESFLLNTYNRIDRENFQFDFITRSDFPAKGEEFLKLGGNIYKVSSYINIFKYIKDIKDVLDKEYDIIHIHKNSAANIIPFLIAKKYKTSKIIAHSHNTAPSKKGIATLLHIINRSILCKNSDVKLACSKKAGEWLYGKQNKFNLILNGIDTKKYLFNNKTKQYIREEFNIPKDAFLIGHVGRFSLQKNHEFLIKIFSEILKRKSNSYLMLIGDGELMPKIKKQIHDLQLEDRVLILGIRSDVEELMKAMDVFIMPSLYEGLPIVAIEAQASGLPVFLSSKISRETQIVDSVFWFSLSDNIKDIVNLIINNNSIKEANRINRNNIIIEAGYSIDKTVETLKDIYINF